MNIEKDNKGIHLQNRIKQLERTNLSLVMQLQAKQLHINKTNAYWKSRERKLTFRIKVLKHHQQQRAAIAI